MFSLAHRLKFQQLHWHQSGCSVGLSVLQRFFFMVPQRFKSGSGSSSVLPGYHSVLVKPDVGAAEIQEDPAVQQLVDAVCLGQAMTRGHSWPFSISMN